MWISLILVLLFCQHKQKWHFAHLLPPHTHSIISAASVQKEMVLLCMFCNAHVQLEENICRSSALTSKHAICAKNEGVKQPDNRCRCKQ